MSQKFSMHRAAVGIGDLLGGAALILCIPLGILLVGLPFALVVRALLGMARML